MDVAAVIAVIEEVLTLMPNLITLGLNLAPLITKIKAAIDALLGSGQITDDQATSLHATTASLESQWNAIVAAAASATGSGGLDSGTVVSGAAVVNS